MTTIRAAILGLVVLGTAAPGSVSAQSATRSFSWFAELVSSDASAKTVTVKALVEAHVTRTLAKLEPGTPIVLMWTHLGSEADAVRYVERAESVPADSGGYIVRGRYVASDAAGRTLTFTTSGSDKVLQTLGTARVGTPIRVASSMEGVPAAVALNERPKPRPVIVAKAAPAAVGPPPAKVAGLWAIDTSIMGNAIKLKCQLEQDSAKLSGTCTGQPLGDVTLTGGGVTGSAVAFQFDVTAFGPALVFSLKGEVDAPGMAMKGMVSVSGFDAPFTAVKQ